MCYYKHIKKLDRVVPLVLALPGSRLTKIKQGRGGFHAQAVSQKTRKKSISKASKKTAAVRSTTSKVGAGKGSVNKSHARPPVKDTRTTTRTTAKVSAAKAFTAKASLTKASPATAAPPKAPAAKAAPAKVVSAKAPQAKPLAKTVVAKTATAKTATVKHPVTKPPVAKTPVTKAPAAKAPVVKAPVVKAPDVKAPELNAQDVKAAAPKSVQNKRSEMPNKTAKPSTEKSSTDKPSTEAAKGAKAASAKGAAAKPSVKAAATKSAAEKAHADKANAAKSDAPKTTASAMKAAAAKENAKAAAAEKPVAAKAPAPAPRAEEPKKIATQRQGFKTNEYVVYPAHGVGQILAIEDQEIAGVKLELFVINFLKDKMTLRVPTAKVANVGMRKLSEPTLVKKALETLKGRARIKRTMWSRRAQEYEAKINSGDIVAIAEVVRDLFRSDSQPEQSYSERQLYEAALDRLSREIAVVQHVTETEAVKEIEGQLAKSPRRGAKAEDAEAGADEADESDDDVSAEDEAA